MRANSDVATNDAAATVPTTARAVGSVLAHAGGEERRDRQGERPAAGDVVGRRREVEGEPGGEAQHERERRLDGQRGRDHDQQAEVGHDAVPGDVREERDLHDQRDDDGREGHQQPEPLHRRLPSASITARSLLEPLGTITPTTSRAEKSTKGLTTARWEASRSGL